MRDDKSSLLHQVSVVKRRLKVAVRELTEAMNGLPIAEELQIPSDSADHDEQCDLQRYCICLEVALDEATKWARKLEERARAVADGTAVAKFVVPETP